MLVSGRLQGRSSSISVQKLRPHWKRRIESFAQRVPGVSKQIQVTAEEAQALILGCTEQSVHRPAHKQRCWYSGKKKPLIKDERDYNHTLSRFRVRVEHALSCIKRFRILSDRFRYPGTSHTAKFSIIADIANIVAGF